MPDYAQRYPQWIRISTGFPESVVNEIIAKRMSKKQQMRWNRPTVHRFLEVRIHVLNGTFEDAFHHWHQGFRPVANPSHVACSSMTTHKFACSRRVGANSGSGRPCFCANQPSVISAANSAFAEQSMIASASNHKEHRFKGTR
jgi:hypothetical protein